ncbi:MAG: hypothetical protein K9M57_10515, partial [Phycisphaerae bacterium]|nr:hypothetical protein [Phycisphaerae bacterium]
MSVVKTRKMDAQNTYDPGVKINMLPAPVGGGYCLWHLAIFVVMLMVIPGCQPPDRSEPLRKENPFRQAGTVDQSNFLVVTCDFSAMELSGTVDLTQQDYWETHSIHSANRPNISGIVEGFEAEKEAV